MSVQPPEATPAVAPPSRLALLRELQLVWRHRHLLGSFVMNDLKYRYVGSSIGFFWTAINPLIELITYTFVFAVILKVKYHPSGGTVHYALFLFCGMVAWMATAEGLQRATISITGNAHLIKKVNFPAAVLPAHVVLSSVVNQFMRVGILGLGAIFLADGISWHFVLVPFFMVLQAVFTLGLGFLLATANVYFRDAAHWLNAVLPAWMFISPIFYPPAAYPRKFGLLLQLNPMSHIVGVYQELILNLRLPDTRQVLMAVVCAGFSLVIGYSVFAHHRKRFADLA